MRSRKLLVAVLIAVFALHGASRARPCPPSTERDGEIAREDRDALSATFAYDAAARINGILTANIDTIDTALTAILAGNVAAVLVMFDKLIDFRHAWDIVAIALFCCSTFACVTGYSIGFARGLMNRDAIRPRRFIHDLIDRRAGAIIGALKTQIDVSETNMTIRIYKRALALAAIALLIGGVVAVGLARWSAYVLH